MKLFEEAFYLNHAQRGNRMKIYVIFAVSNEVNAIIAAWDNHEDVLML